MIVASRMGVRGYLLALGIQGAGHLRKRLATPVKRQR
jgi:hypothetical protein